MKTSTRFGVVGVALVLTALVIWLGFAIGYGVMIWLDKAPNPVVRLIAAWGWMGPLLAAIPTIKRSRRDNS